MTMRDLWDAAEMNHIFIRIASGSVIHVLDGPDGPIADCGGTMIGCGSREVKSICSKKYPMYGNVLEVTLAD